MLNNAMMIAVITSCLLIAGGTHPSPEVNFSALQAHLSKLRSSARKTAKEVKQNMLKVGGPQLGKHLGFAVWFIMLYGCLLKIQ